MSKAIQIIETGGVEVMKLIDMPLKSGGPAVGEIRIKHEAIGVNYIDTYVNFIPTFTQDANQDPGLCEVHVFAPFIQFTPFKSDLKIIVDVNVIEWKFLEYFWGYF